MFLELATAILLPPTIYFLNCLWCLRTNVQLAKRSGIPYVVVPRYNYNRIIGLASRYPMRLLNLIDPETRYTPGSWRHVVKILWPWNLRYAPFKELNTDTFLTVAPGGLILNSADADVISQITTRSNDFPKPIEHYTGVDIYGKNIISTEGATWRRHRKTTALAFSEKTNRLVWKETLKQTGDMLKTWTQGNGLISSLASDTMRLSLHVMSRAVLGEEMQWTQTDDRPLTQSIAPTDHTMTFTECLTYLLKNLMYVLVLPRWVLKNSFSQTMRKTNSAYDEFEQYMRDMLQSKAKRKSSIESASTDLLSQLVQVSQEDPKDASMKLSDDEVIGNLFVFIIAGHETSGSSIHFCLLLLALNPQYQCRVQEELDDIIGGRQASTWRYDSDLPRLQNSLLQAVLFEQLRIISPIVAIPKTVADLPQPLQISGEEHLIPTGTIIRLCVPSVHRNPKYWPSGPPSDPNVPFHPPCDQSRDLEEFKPARWITDSQQVTSDGTTFTQHSFISPPRGSYIPFSLDSRACVGRRFATVEVLAALAMILSIYTIELAVDEADAEAIGANEGSKGTGGNSREAKKRAWEWTRDRGNHTWQNKCKAIITLQIRDGAVPVRIVPRGQERFGKDVLGF